MTDPIVPDLKQPHGLVRSRTPEQRNAERAKRDQAKIAKKEAATAAKNAQPRAGQGVRVDGPMITVTGGNARGGVGGGLEVMILDSNGTLVYAALQGTITGVVPAE